MRQWLFRLFTGTAYSQTKREQEQAAAVITVEDMRWEQEEFEFTAAKPVFVPFLGQMLDVYVHAEGEEVAADRGLLQS